MLSSLKKLVGRRPSNKPTQAKEKEPKTPNESIQSIKQVISNLEARQTFLGKKANHQIQIAKEKSKAGDKRGAILALKTKKMQEQEIIKIDASILNLSEQILAIESASVNMDITGAMMIGKNALKEINEKINVENIQQLQDDIHENMNDVHDVNNILSQPVGMFANLDDDDMMKELQAIQESELDDNVEKELEALIRSDTAPKPKASHAMKSKDAKRIEEDGLFADIPNAPTSSVNTKLKPKTELSALGLPPVPMTAVKSATKDEHEDELDALRKRLAM